MGRVTAKRKVRRKVLRPRPTFTPLTIESRPLGAFTLKGRYQPSPFGAPSSLTIAGDTWRICYHTNLYGRRTKGSRLSRLLGFVQHSERTIVIDPDQHPAEREKTLLHEALHCALAIGRGLDETVARLSHKAEESICRVLERTLSGMAWG